MPLGPVSLRLSGRFIFVALHPEDRYLAKKQKPALNVLVPPRRSHAPLYMQRIRRPRFTGSPATKGRYRMTEKIICPICKSEAEAINVGLFDGVGIRCKTLRSLTVATHDIAAFQVASAQWALETGLAG